MFYEACRCGGLPENQAKVVYAAVYHFGPRWVITTVKEVKKSVSPKGAPVLKTVEIPRPQRLKSAEEPAEDVRRKLEKYVQERNPSLEELKKLDPKSL
jgi:hypothetical protein